MSQSGEEAAAQTFQVAMGRAKSRSLGPLRDLVPFLEPYRWRIVAALVALIFSSAVSLLIPQAIRVMVDYGFHQADVARIGRYFLPLIGAAALLGIFTATRFYFVTWIG